MDPWCTVYVVGAVATLLVAVFIEGLTDSDSEFTAIVCVAGTWPLMLPAIAAYVLGAWLRERG